MPDEVKETPEAAKATVADNKSPNVVAGLETSKKDPDATEATAAVASKKALDDAKAQQDAEFEEALKQEDNKLTPRQQKLVEAQLDKDGPDEVDPETELAAGDALGQKLQALVAGIPETTPDEHVIWGAAGITLLLKDIRLLAKHYGLSKG
jgi:hypothetical protein